MSLSHYFITVTKLFSHKNYGIKITDGIFVHRKWTSTYVLFYTTIISIYQNLLFFFFFSLNSFWSAFILFLFTFCDLFVLGGFGLFRPFGVEPVRAAHVWEVLLGSLVDRRLPERNLPLEC